MVTVTSNGSVCKLRSYVTKLPMHWFRTSTESFDGGGTISFLIRSLSEIGIVTGQLNFVILDFLK